MSDAQNVITHSEPMGDGELVRLEGDIDFSRSPDLRQGLLKRMRNKPARLIIDLGGVPYMDSSGVATLVEALQAQRQAGGKLVLCNLQSKVRGIFEIAKLDMVFTITDDVEAAASA